MLKCSSPSSPAKIKANSHSPSRSPRAASSPPPPPRRTFTVYTPSQSQSPIPKPANPETKTKKKKKKSEKPRRQQPSSLDRTGLKPLSSNLPFDFRYSYTESSPNVRPIGLREPKYSPFGPGRLDREWTGVCEPAVDRKVRLVEGAAADELKLEEKRRKIRERVQGEPLTAAERKILVDKCQRLKTKSQVNLGRDGLTHNMLKEIHNHWRYAEAVRIKCLGVPTVDMKNVCTQIEDTTFGKIIYRYAGLLILYRGREYNHRKTPVIPLMLWRPHAPVYPKLIKTTVDGLSIEETKEMRKRGLAVPALTKLDLVPCILVTFEKEQTVVWKGNDYKPPEYGYLYADKELFDEVNTTSTPDDNGGQ